MYVREQFLMEESDLSCQDKTVAYCGQELCLKIIFSGINEVHLMM
jgi:hypothetical protein